MKQLVAFPVTNVSTLLVEVESTDWPGAAPAARPDVILKAQETVDAAFGKLRPGLEHMIQFFDQLIERPNEFEVEFAIKLTAEAGAVIASTSTEANFRVVMRWTNSHAATS
jgi:Trypsin-co-occurring domain 1